MKENKISRNQFTSGKRRIVVTHVLDEEKLCINRLKTDINPLQDFENITLVNRGKEHDIIFAHENGNYAIGCLYIGHWNDGVLWDEPSEESKK